MLSYRHSYHAGNHADVLKHATVALLVEALKKKEGPFAYIETHAGAGRYDLRSEQAQKTGEYLEGIARIWREPAAPAALGPYLDAVRALNSGGELTFYPGSPRVVRHLLRPQDRMALMELHNNEYPVLKQEFAGDRLVAVHHRDGYEGLNALLPPKEKRGLVLIDPSYEVKSEYGQVVTSLAAAVKRWSNGIYAIWYPLLASAQTDTFMAQFRATGLRKLLRAEITVRGEGIGMYGSGMLVLNPPWRLDSQLQELLPWVVERLSPGAGQSLVEWLVPE